jgi:predicted neuraminidase
VKTGAPVIFSLLVASQLVATLFAQSSEKAMSEPFRQYDGIIRPSPLQGAQEAYLSAPFPSSHGANFLFLKNGELLCFWFSGEWEGDSDVGIMVSRLAKGSGQWSKPRLIDHERGKSYQNPVAFQAPGGRIWLLHTSQDAGQGQSNANVLLVTSDDNGHAWNGPAPLFMQPGSFVRQPLVLTARNEWLLPMYYTPSKGIINGAESNYSVTKISSDSGKSWKECRIPNSNGAVHPNVLQLGEASFVAFFRSRFADWIYKSTSDDGCNWTAPAATQLPNNNSSIQATLLRNGRLLIAFNNNNAVSSAGKAQAALRKPLSVAISEDGGKTWPWIRDVETGDAGITGVVGDPLDKSEHVKGSAAYDEYSYPTVVQGPDGRIHIAFTYRRERIKYMSFNEEWIRQGTTTGRFKGDIRK